MDYVKRGLIGDMDFKLIKRFNNTGVLKNN